MTRRSGADVLLSDGALSVVRPLLPADAPGLHDLHERVSDEALRTRFFAASRGTAHKYVDHVFASPATIALVAEVDGRIAALATAEPITDDLCEVAFLVADEHGGRGLGTLLLEHLAAEARDRGFREFEARVLRSNQPMLAVFRDAGFRGTRRFDGWDAVLRMSTAVTPTIQAAADQREFMAEQRSLAPLFAPRGVVVYGVRRDGTGIGASVVSSILAGRFNGPTAIVHPHASNVLDVPAYPRAREAPEPLDLAVITVPADAVVAALEDAALAGVRAAVVISSGFQEMGTRGGEMQLALARCARRHGIRIVGPNGLGLITNDPDVRLHATFGGTVPAAGGLAVASQSGGVGIALMDLVARSGIGIRCFVSLGNKADVSGNDLLAAWYGDDQVTCAALYLESFGNPRKFARFARTFSERKPLLAVVGGRSTAGRRAGASHTAAAASPAAGVRALFAQAGVIECQDAEQLAETALLLTREPVPAGDRVAVVSNAGGMGVLAADRAMDENLQVVEFSPGLSVRIGALVNNTNGTSNPVDAGAGAGPEQVAAITDAILGSGEVDSVIVVLVATGANDLAAAISALADVRRQHPAQPLVVVSIGGGPLLDSDAVTSFRTSAAALGALGRVSRYAVWRSAPREDAEPTDPHEVHQARATARSLLEGASEQGGWVHPQAARDLLGPYRIELAGRFARDAVEAAAIAAGIGFPVAVKVADPVVVHRTERGLVRSGLDAPAEVESAVEWFEQQHGSPCTVMVQAMATGVELVLGVVRDPAFGPLVMVGAGGVATDVWDDRAFLVPPFAESEARRVLRSLRLWPLLAGFRGAPATAVGEVAQLAVRLGRLAVDVPEVAEIDLNPVMAGPQGCVVVDAKVRLAGAGAESTDLPRQLRRPQ
ncbi:MAG: GNAT family N-acetyltransferase [Propionibacteriales bacterium]|nr:GNAT family N-acetyltransferase [Propionibacteriales bacterium]